LRKDRNSDHEVSDNVNSAESKQFCQRQTGKRSSGDDLIAKVEGLQIRKKDDYKCEKSADQPADNVTGGAAVDDFIRAGGRPR